MTSWHDICDSHCKFLSFWAYRWRSKKLRFSSWSRQIVQLSNQRKVSFAMNCFRSIYFFIVLLLLMGLVVIFHANMMLIYFQEEDSFNLKFKSLSLKQNPPNINRMLLFDRLISFFNLFKSKIPPAKEADKLLKFIEKRFPTIFNCEYIQISKFNSTLLFEVQGNKSKQGSQSDNPFLVGLDLDSDSILDGWSMHHPHFQVDYINEAITGIGATSSKSLVMVFWFCFSI